MTLTPASYYCQGPAITAPSILGLLTLIIGIKLIIRLSQDANTG